MITIRKALVCFLPLLAFGCESRSYEYYVRDLEIPKPRQSARPGQPAMEGPVEVDARGAVLMALERNSAFAIQRIGSEDALLAFDEADSAFDPSLRIAAQALSIDGESQGTGLLQVAQPFSGGTVVGAEASSSTGVAEFSRQRLFIAQPLAQGAGRDVNLAFIRQAGLDVMMSDLDFRDYAMGFVAEVEKAYWDLSLDEMQIAIYEESLRLAGQQLAETEERVRIGRLAETDLAAARAEVALRREALINARSALATGRLRFLHTLNPGPDPWALKVVLTQTPEIPEEEPGGVEGRIELAMKRPDVEAMRLALARGELDLLRVRNGLLPRLDLFASVDRSSDGIGFGSGNDDYIGQVELSLTHTFPNRAQRTRKLRTELTLDSARLALDDFERRVQLEVRTAFIETERSREQVAATAATRASREEALRAEVEKFRVGRSTTLQVAQAQRDLAASQVSEARAVVSHLKAITDLHQAEGTILERRGIVVGAR